MTSINASALAVYECSIDNHISNLRREAFEYFSNACERCESPIEQQLLAELMWLGPSIWFSGGYSGPLAPARSQIVLTPQYIIGQYRVDFAITCASADPAVDNEDLKIVVECDGHDFHEKTKYQAARDKSRDRTLAELGWRVFRFTGSEIHRDASGCAMQVMEAIAATANACFDKGIRRESK